MVRVGFLLFSFLYAFSHSTSLTGFAPLVKPHAYPVYFPGAGQPFLGLVTILGHSVTWRPVDTDFVEIDEPMLGMCDTPDGLIRCHHHTLESLQDTYDLHRDSFGQLARVYEEGGHLIIHDTPHKFAIGQASFEDAFLNPANLPGVPGPVPVVHHELANRALRYRYGQHQYARCGELCDTSYSVHKNAFDLVWSLAPLWEHSSPRRATIVDFGCGSFSGPLVSLLESGFALSGVCVDANEEALFRAREKLAAHKVHVKHAFLTPGIVPSLLRESLGSAQVDVLKVKIDSFNAQVLEAALSVLTPSAIIVQYLAGVPPPLLFSLHYTEGAGTSADFPGASISYFVSRLAVFGFFLYKASELDLLFVRDDLAAKLTAADPALVFPVDEFACYLETPLFLGDLREARWTPRVYAREWLLDPDPLRAMGHMWGNVTRLLGPEPFVLDVTAPRALSAMEASTDIQV